MHTIQSISIYRMEVPLREPFIISLGPIEQVQNVVVRIQSEQGVTGWGECSPFATINGETIDTCLVVGRMLAKALQGKDAADISGCVQQMDRIIWANSSIKSAFDIALHDLAAQAAGLPLYQYLGGNQPRTLYTDMTVSLDSPNKMAADALRFQQQGFSVLKVKLGSDLDTDVTRIRTIRSAIGPDLPLRIDANQGWPDASTALQVLQALAPFNIQHCEEPIPRWLYLQLPELSKASPVPVMADECLFDHHDAERLISLEATPLFNIKLGKSGGLHKAMKIAQLAEKAGIGLQAGGFMESRLGMTAAAHLALASPAFRFCDLDTPLMFTHDPVIGGMVYGPGGQVSLPEGLGLGAAPNLEWLQQVVTD